MRSWRRKSLLLRRCRIGCRRSSAAFRLAAARLRWTHTSLSRSQAWCGEDQLGAILECLLLDCCCQWWCDSTNDHRCTTDGRCLELHCWSQVIQECSRTPLESFEWENPNSSACQWRVKLGASLAQRQLLHWQFRWSHPPPGHAETFLDIWWRVQFRSLQRRQGPRLLCTHHLVRRQLLRRHLVEAWTKSVLSQAFCGCETETRWSCKPYFASI